MSDLPPRLEYLAPFLQHLAALDPEDIHEDLDVGPLLAALKKRVASRSIDDAAALIQGDRGALVSWLQNNPEHPGHFVAAFLEPPELAEHLAEMRAPKRGVDKPKKPASPKFRISLEAPHGFKGMAHRGGYVLIADQVAVVFTPSSAAQQASAMEFAYGAVPSEVQFDRASGICYPLLGRTFYHLSVDGRHFDVVVEAPGRSVDPAFIATLIDQAEFK